MNLAALFLYGYRRHFVQAVEPEPNRLRGLHERYGTAPGIELVCYTYVTTFLVTADPEQGTTLTTNECSFMLDLSYHRRRQY